MNQTLSTPDWPTLTPREQSRVVRADTDADSDPKPSTVLLAGIIVAGVLHLAIIFGVTFEDIRERYIPPSLDVILVNETNVSEPESAKFLAEHSQLGGGTSESPKRQTAPVSGTETNKNTGEAPKLVKASSPDETRTAANDSITQIFSDHQIADQHEQKQVNKVIEAKEAEALNTRMEIARLTAELDQELEEHASRPKTLYVTASTKESTAANYMLEWVKKVERVGNLNYPSIAYKVSGSLVLVVGINQHGGITEIAVKRSSGITELDDAAVNIVKLAEPFAPMSNRLARETDVIYITRTWQFSSEHSLYSY